MRLGVLGIWAALQLAGGAAAVAATPHNVVIFVADGLRSGMVTSEHAPNMAALRAEGVDLRNSHSVYPTLTTPNASAIATGHWPGDTGDFGNLLYVGQATSRRSASTFAAVEDDEVLGGLNALYQGNYLDETSLMAAARRAGLSTAVIGKLGPVGIQDVTEREGRGTVVVDDLTGRPGGFPLAPDVLAGFRAAGLQPVTPDRGASGAAARPDDLSVVNIAQQDWFTSAATQVLLPLFKARSRPFLLVLWSLAPDGAQHLQGDSRGVLTPGINGATSLAAIRTADDDLGRLRAALQRLGLADTTDVVVLSDHGFSTVSKASRTSEAAKQAYPGVPQGELPPGFLAIDLAAGLDLPLANGTGEAVDWRHGHHPGGGARLGADPAHPSVAVAANGGSDLVYLPGPDAGPLARRIVGLLTAEDYTGAIFVNDRLGAIPGTLPMSAVNLKGHALTREPDVVVSFRSFSTGCADPELCAAEVADTSLGQGQGMHGSFSRADTHNVMAAVGPDFRRGFRDPAPASNADVAPTLAEVLHLDLPAIGRLRGRVLREALTAGGDAPAVQARRLASPPAANGFTTVLGEQDADGHAYFDAAGAPGRVVGLP